MFYVPFPQSRLYSFSFTSWAEGMQSSEGRNVKTYCILCLSRGQAGPSSRPRSSGWPLSTWSRCCHTPCIQSGSRSANNHRNKLLFEPVFMGQLCFSISPGLCASPNYPLLGSHSYPLPFIPSRALCFVLFSRKLSGQTVSWHWG